VQEEMEAQLIEVAIRKLSIEEHFLLRQRYEDELSIKELAIYYSLTKSAIKMRLKRLNDHLRDRYLQLAVQ
jgi:predicted DNA-binding protein YlxM (UPF0122 family)